MTDNYAEQLLRDLWRLRVRMAEATGSQWDKLQDEESAKWLEVCSYLTARSEPLQVVCARCGEQGTSETFQAEEGDEWECPQCWERCEAEERAARSARASNE